MHSFANSLRFSAALLGTNVRATLALRGAFLLLAVFMLLNNLAFFSMWLIFFERFDNVRGWMLGDVAVVFGVCACGFGLGHILFGGAPDISRMVVGGELDIMLIQPKSVLLQTVGSRSSASAWGDLVTGVAFVALAGKLDGSGAPAFLLATVASALGFIAVRVIYHSAAFWLGRVETLASMLSEFTLTFSLYPRPIFAGGVRVLLFTAIPAGLVGWFPVDAVREPGLGTLALACGGAAGLVALAVLVFNAGLRRYESGSRFGTQG